MRRLPSARPGSVAVGPREFHTQLPSTQDRALALARAGAADGTRVVARRQSRGRGRADHSWSSPDGGLYLSIVLAATPAPSPLLPLGIGSTLAGAIGRRYRLRVRTKWPNDLIVEVDHAPRKLGGILVDEVDSPSLGRAWVVGVGVNVLAPSAPHPGGVSRTAASLAELVSPPPTVDAVEELAVEACLATRSTLSGPDGPAELVRRCRDGLFGVGLRVAVDGRPAGRIAGLADDGALIVDTGDVALSVRSGDVTIEEAA
jgi:BirA family transcriptional regulator, biotin operon repressor / biotin---[acetyl-CoA-carboxylase] ligase